MNTEYEYELNMNIEYIYWIYLNYLVFYLTINVNNAKESWCDH